MIERAFPPSVLAMRSFFQDPPECGPTDAEALGGTGLIHIFFVQDVVDDVRFDLFEGAAQIKVLRRFMTLLGLPLAIIAATAATLKQRVKRPRNRAASARRSSRLCSWLDTCLIQCSISGGGVVGRCRMELT